jgi:hypothetical protein
VWSASHPGRFNPPKPHKSTYICYSSNVDPVMDLITLCTSILKNLSRSATRQNFRFFMELEFSLTCSEWPGTVPYAEPNYSSPHPQTPITLNPFKRYPSIYPHISQVAFSIHVVRRYFYTSIFLTFLQPSYNWNAYILVVCGLPWLTEGNCITFLSYTSVVLVIKWTFNVYLHDDAKLTGVCINPLKPSG